MTSQNGATVIVIPNVSRMRAYANGEVLCGTFEGHPLISIFDPISKRGGACRLKQGHIEIDFNRWIQVLKREFGSDINRLQIKFIVGEKDEPIVKTLCAKHGLKPQAIAAFEDKARLDVFFFTDAGRLRIAPSVQSFRETSKSFNFRKEKAKIKVLVVDDSVTMRRILGRIISQSPELEVVAEAERPSEVEGLITKYQPDVITLDINLPEMSGVQLLKRILAYRFIPTVMISALSVNEGNEVLNALELGAVDYIQKPAAHELEFMTPFIHEKLIAAARVRVQRLVSAPARTAPVEGAVHAPPVQANGAFSSSSLIAIGASTGGTEAIKQIFVKFPEQTPPIVVVQHIPPYFSTAFANRLNEICEFEVIEGKDGDEVKPGRAIIAPGGYHMVVRKEGRKLVVRLQDGDPVNRFKPAVDVLFRSVAKEIGGSAVGVLLTGMGSDGAKGLLEMKQAGSFTIAQDEESCIVYGMPRAAVEIGAAVAVEALDDIPSALMAQKAAA